MKTIEIAILNSKGSKIIHETIDEVNYIKIELYDDSLYDIKEKMDSENKEEKHD